MILPASYSNGFAPRDGQPLYPELWRGCVGAWNPGLGPSGLTLRDWSGFGNHGTLTNMDPGTDWVVSGGRYALDFDGANDFIDIANVGLLVSANQRYAVEAWFSVRSFANQPLIYTWTAQPGANDLGFIEFNSTGNQILWGVRSTLLSQAQFRTYTVPSLGSGMHHILAQKTGPGNAGNLYLNGVLQTSFTGILYDSPLGTSSLHVGIYTNGLLPLNGIIREFRLYNQIVEQNAKLLATRPGIAYEMAPRGWTSQQLAAYRARYYSQIIGGGIA